LGRDRDCPNQVVHGSVRVRDVAIHLRRVNAIGREGKGSWFGIARLDFEFRKVDCATIEAARRAGLEARQFESRVFEARAHLLG
jgi:hypothetical protein